MPVQSSLFSGQSVWMPKRDAASTFLRPSSMNRVLSAGCALTFQHHTEDALVRFHHAAFITQVQTVEVVANRVPVTIEVAAHSPLHHIRVRVRQQTQLITPRATASACQGCAVEHCPHSRARHHSTPGSSRRALSTCQVLTRNCAAVMLPSSSCPKMPCCW